MLNITKFLHCGKMLDESLENKKYMKALTTDPGDESLFSENQKKNSNKFPENALTIKQTNNVIYVFGNDIRIKSPFRVGNAFTFCFINRKPLFFIGPNCKIKYHNLK